MSVNCITELLCELLNCHGKIDFFRVKYEGVDIQGKIKMIKLELEQEVEIFAHAVDRRGRKVAIQEGSAQWFVIANDANGNEVPGALEIRKSDADEMRAVLRSTGEEVTGLVTLRVDGDPDEGEEAVVVATLDVIVDAGNAVAIQLSAGTPTDVVAEEPSGEEPGEEVPTEGEESPEEPVEEEPTGEEPAEEVPSEEVPAEEEPTEENPVEETPSEETPAEEPVEETPDVEPVEGEVPAGETPAEEVPTEEPSGEFPDGGDSGTDSGVGSDGSAGTADETGQETEEESQG